MARRMIFDTAQLTFNTFREGYQDPTTRLWVDGGKDKTVRCNGDLQPFLPRGNEQISAPEGFSLVSSKMFITSAQLPTIDDVGNKKAAQTIIDGRTYFVFRKYDYSAGRLSTDCIFYVLLMQPMTDGSV